jgi:hypothetical protein
MFLDSLQILFFGFKCSQSSGYSDENVVLTPIERRIKNEHLFVPGALRIPYYPLKRDENVANAWAGNELKHRWQSSAPPMDYSEIGRSAV